MKSEPATVASTPDSLPELDNPPGAENGSPSPRRSRLPRARGLSNRVKILAAVAVALVVGTCAAAAYALLSGPRAAERPDLVRHKVKRERLELTIVERGALESAKNSDIYCRVKARTQGSTIATQIKSLIDDGSEVKGPRPDNPNGDLLVELDDSGLLEQLKTQKITVDK